MSCYDTARKYCNRKSLKNWHKTRRRLFSESAPALMLSFNQVVRLSWELHQNVVMRHLSTRTLPAATEKRGCVCCHRCRDGSWLMLCIYPGLTSNDDTHLIERSRYAFVSSPSHVRQGLWDGRAREDSSLKRHTLWLMTYLKASYRGKFSWIARVVWSFTCRASKGLVSSHLCFSRSAAHPGEKKKGSPPLCQVDSMTPLSPATLSDPLSSVSSTGPPPVSSHCSDLKLYPRGESSRQQRTCDTKLWMNLSS